MDAALALGLRHALDAVRATLELEDRVGAVAGDPERDLLEAADLRGARGEDLGPEPEPLRVASEHRVEVAGEERRLVATGAGPDLDDHIRLVVGIALDHRQADLFRKFLEPRRGVRDQRLQLGVGGALVEQLAGAGEIVGEGRVFGGQLAGGAEVAVLAAELGVALPVGNHRRVGELALELRVALGDWLTSSSIMALSVTTAAERLPERPQLFSTIPGSSEREQE